MSNTEQFCISLLNNCKTLKTITQVQAHAHKTGLNTNPLIAGKLILHCAVLISNALDYARLLFDQTPNPDVFMHNALIRGFAESDSPKDSIFTYIQMRKETSFPPDSFSFAFALKSVANSRNLGCGFQLHCEAIKHGLSTHVFVGTTLISMYAECGCLESARKVFDEITEPNVVAWNVILTACFRCDDINLGKEIFRMMTWRDLTSWNVVLSGYTKAGELELAKNLFVEMPEKDDVSWSTMIVGFAHNGLFDEAFGFFREMLGFGIRPNEVSLSGILSACAQSGAFEFGRVVHGYIEKAGTIRISSISNALLDTYSKCGYVGMARLVFDRILEKNSIISWTSMISGLAMQGYGEEAIKLFDEMEKSGIRPDGVTLISILYACSHAGLIEKGNEYFRNMTEIYGIEPSIEHYGCIVDLYGRNGQLQRAYEFVCQMPMPPNAVIWRTLLGACTIHDNVELAEQVKERLCELDPNNSSDYVLLSNVYAVSGKWNDASVVRRSMIDRRMKKAPGWSMIEVDKIMYSFMAGQKLDEVTEEAYEKLKEIMSKIGNEGYTPEVRYVLYDVEKEEKEDALAKHSEKLAVAFGLARLRIGGVIRIVKNLRICKDCHNVMKMISKVYGVGIVVRDRSRFHSFDKGRCSCKDYW